MQNHQFVNNNKSNILKYSLILILAFGLSAIAYSISLLQLVLREVTVTVFNVQR